MVLKGGDVVLDESQDGDDARSNIMTELIAHARSAGVRNPKLRLFEIPGTDMSISARREVRVNPLTTGLNPITFKVDRSSDYIDLDNSFFELDLTMKLNNGNNLATATTIQLANNLAHTLFRQITVRLNGTLISPMTDTYHLLAMIQTMLDNDKQDGKDLLAPQGWYNSFDVPDNGDADEITANQQDNVTPHADYTALAKDKKVVVHNRLKFLGGNTVRLRFTPNLEIFRLGKLLVPGVELQFEMYLNNPDLYAIRYAGANTLRQTEADVQCRLYIQQIRVKDSIYAELTAKMAKGAVVSYPTVRGVVRTFPHPTGQQHFECQNPFTGQVPNRLVVALLKQTAFNGAIGDNPFNFQKFSLSTIKVLVSGEEYPYETLQLNHDNGHRDLAGYHRFLEATGCRARGHGNLVGPGDWGHGKKANLFVFDLAANGLLDSPTLNPRQRGELRLVLDFGADPGANLTVVVYGEFENLMEIDRDKAVIYDVHQ